MRARRYYVLACILILVGAGIWIFNMNPDKTSLDAVIWQKFNTGQVRSINIVNDQGKGKQVNLTDPDDIQMFIQKTSGMEIRKTSDANLPFDDSYTIIVKDDQARRFGMILYNNRYIDIYDYDQHGKKNASQLYSISNDWDANFIRDLLK
ncbi:hypothetical protein [Paenibacillus wulumuqiensis]|uniref:hypothetical protein n=1 Tax=Paenibacillus wulumuqiensis TaxID=1567107 RepID=UPI0006195067|nr:hypothetical protein [Paenibacillus wulumuqiensis]